LYRRILAIVAAVLVLLVAAPPPSPVHLSYVTSDSMEPTLHPGDAYVVTSFGTVEAGDVVTFRSPERDGYVTHRVVEVTASGYVTKGDANPSTDQAAGSPPIPRSAVLGEAVAVGGVLVVFPGLGTALSAVGAGAAPAAVALVSLGLMAILLGDGTRIPDREVVYVRDVVGPLLVGLGVTVVAVALVASSTHPVAYPVAEPGSGPDGALAVGEPADRTMTMEVSRPPVTRVVLDADGMRVVDQTVDGSTVRATVRIPPQEATGTVEGAIRVRAYPATLPPAVLESLDDVHPAAAWAGSTGVVFAPLVGAYLLLFDGRSTVRLRDLRWLRNRGGRR
jgi:signal peptidase